MNAYYLSKAHENEPVLFYEEVDAVCTVRPVQDDSFFGCRMERAGTVPAMLRTGDSFILDFGRHCVGRLSFRLSECTVHIDAPARIRLKFAETPYELQRDFKSYHGSLCASWLQEEVVYADMRGVIRLPRRYAFRYLQVTAEAVPKPVALTEFHVRCETSADVRQLEPLPAGTDPLTVKIDDVAAATLRDCMQKVYEDGPKRDRRLWSGDLRLQALTDQMLFHNDRLARHCLYLFAACDAPDKYLPACLFREPEPEMAERNEITDYAMLYCVTLCDYYENTGDRATAKDLFPVAMHQIEHILAGRDANGIVTLPDGWNSFIDWAAGLERRTAVHGAVLYALERMIPLAAALGETEYAERWEKARAELRESAQKHLYHAERGAFINAYDRNQYSVQSQVWMILGGVPENETQGRKLLTDALQDAGAVQPVTPYMHHYLVEAMLKSGMREEASRHIREYWGQMVENGADTFWEVFVSGHPEISPYGDPLMHSFCHAWSCSASWFIRKYHL